MKGFGFGSGGDKKKKGAASHPPSIDNIVDGVRLDDTVLPSAYDANALRKHLDDLTHVASHKVDKIGFCERTIYQAYMKDKNMQEAISTSRNVLMKAYLKDFYSALSQAAIALKNCNLSSPEAIRSSGNINCAAIICFAASKEPDLGFESLLYSAYYLYLIVGDEFKEQMKRDPLVYISAKLAEKRNKHIPLTMAIDYTKLVLEQYGLKVNISPELYGTSESGTAGKKEQDDTQFTGNYVGEPEGYNTVSSTAAVKNSAAIPDPDIGSQMDATVAPLPSMSSNLPQDVSALYNPSSSAPVVPQATEPVTAPVTAPLPQKQECRNPDDPQLEELIVLIRNICKTL